MAQEIVVIVSCPNSLSEKIAKPLVQEKLAACVSIIPEVKSIYTWQNELCSEAESLLLIKTHRGKFSALEKRIKELHTYQIPEIIALSIESGHQPYLKWLNESLN